MGLCVRWDSIEMCIANANFETNAIPKWMYLMLVKSVFINQKISMFQFRGFSATVENNTPQLENCWNQHTHKQQRRLHRQQQWNRDEFICLQSAKEKSLAIIILCFKKMDFLFVFTVFSDVAAAADAVVSFFFWLFSDIYSKIREWTWASWMWIQRSKCHFSRTTNSSGGTDCGKQPWNSTKKKWKRTERKTWKMKEKASELFADDGCFWHDQFVIQWDHLFCYKNWNHWHSPLVCCCCWLASWCFLLIYLNLYVMSKWEYLHYTCSGAQQTG